MHFCLLNILFYFNNCYLNIALHILSLIPFKCIQINEYLNLNKIKQNCIIFNAIKYSYIEIDLNISIFTHLLKPSKANIHSLY